MTTARALAAGPIDWGEPSQAAVEVAVEAGLIDWADAYEAAEATGRVVAWLPIDRPRLEAARRERSAAVSAIMNDPELVFMLAVRDGTAAGARAPARAPIEFVVRHFDRFAESFDDKLLNTLHYRTPDILLEEVGKMVGKPAGTLHVLDAGCGTGLCGPLVRPLAQRLVGVDLSPRMLDKARERGVYDDLLIGELTAVLAAARDEYDLVLAADVLVYFGDLAPVFAGAAGALRPGGILGISVERHDEGDYILHAGGRFAHSIGYLRKAAAVTGLVEIRTTACELRLERGRPVPGYVSIFCKP